MLLNVFFLQFFCYLLLHIFLIDVHVIFSVLFNLIRLFWYIYIYIYLCIHNIKNAFLFTQIRIGTSKIARPQQSPQQQEQVCLKYFYFLYFTFFAFFKFCVVSLFFFASSDICSFYREEAEGGKFVHTACSSNSSSRCVIFLIVYLHSESIVSTFSASNVC